MCVILLCIAVGLSLVKLDRIEGKKIFISSLDLIEGTPILDIKPYHPADRLMQYQQVSDSHHADNNNDISNINTNHNNHNNNSNNVNSNINSHDNNNTTPNVYWPSWMSAADSPSNTLSISILPEAELQLHCYIGKLEFYSEYEDILQALFQVISGDPRPVYIKQKSNNSSAIYGYRFDRLNIRYSIDCEEKRGVIHSIQYVDYEELYAAMKKDGILEKKKKKREENKNDEEIDDDNMDDEDEDARIEQWTEDYLTKLWLAKYQPKENEKNIQ